MGKKAKVINLLLEDGTLNDVVKIAEDEWIGRFYSIPRSKAESFIKKDINCSKWGIYLLLSCDCVYIGQSQNLKKRIKQHLLHKNWWETVVILTTNDDHFNKSDIDYLENKLIEKAFSLKTLDVDNIKKGNIAKVDEFRETTLNQYLDESLFLLEFIGVKVFSDKKKNNINSLIPKSTDNMKTLREKKEVLNYLNDLGIYIEDNLSYARIQDNKNAYWINPNTNILNSNWTLILNNFKKNEIYILNIPENSFDVSYPKENGKLVARKNRPVIELLIDANTFIDKYSGISFKKYISNNIKY